MSAPRLPARYHGYEARFAFWAESLGWGVTKRGWPDFICRRDGQLMAVEVKGGNDDLSPEQIDMLNDLRAVGLPVYVWHEGLGVKEWRGKAPESPARLKLEIGKLHELIREIIGFREAMPPVPRSNRPDKKMTLDQEVARVNEWCIGTHQSHPRPDNRMSYCGWIHYLISNERSAKYVGEILGITPEHVERLAQGARKTVERSHHARIHMMFEDGICEECDAKSA